MKQLKKSKRPVILTVKGKAAAVFRDAEAYPELLDMSRLHTRGRHSPGLEEARSRKGTARAGLSGGIRGRDRKEVWPISLN